MKDIEILKSTQDWEAFLIDKGTTYKIIFKHSPYCSISAGAYRKFLEFAQNVRDRDEIRLALVDVISSKNVSNLIADRLGVKHESPQCIILDNSGKVLEHVSHHEISEKFFLNKTKWE